MELKQVDTLFLKTLYLAEAGIVVSQVLNLDSLTSMLFLFTFPFTALLWIRAIRHTFTGTDLIMVVTCALAVIGVLLNAAVAGAGLSFGYLKKLIMFIMALLFFQTAYRIRMDEAMSGFIRSVVDWLVVFLIGMYFLRTDQMYILNGIRTVYLTFRFTNPNMTGLFLSCLFMLKMHRLFDGGKWYIVLINILQQLILAWFVMETKSRNCLLVLSAYTAFSVWTIFRGHRNLRIGKGWAVLVALFPILLVAAYMTLVSNRWILNLFSFLVSEGKGLDSRVAIWQPALQKLGRYPVFGAYYQASAGTGLFQMHNSHLDIAVSYGIPVLVLVCVLLTRYLHRQGRVYGSRKEYIYILGFAFAILLGMGEAAVFSGGLGIYIFAGTFLLLANQKPPERKDGLSV